LISDEPGGAPRERLQHEAVPQAEPVAELHRLVLRLVLFGFFAGAASMGFALLAAGWRP
jgi:hypothetical protein